MRSDAEHDVIGAHAVCTRALRDRAAMTRPFVRFVALALPCSLRVLRGMWQLAGCFMQRTRLFAKCGVAGRIENRRFFFFSEIQNEKQYYDLIGTSFFVICKILIKIQFCLKNCRWSFEKVCVYLKSFLYL